MPLRTALPRCSVQPSIVVSKLNIDASRRGTLTDQIVSEIRRLLGERALRPGARLPSIRQVAATLGVSTFTVVQAYDRLVASGHVQSRRGVGFFAADRVGAGPEEARLRLNGDPDLLRMIRRQPFDIALEHLPGCGWPPPPWLNDSGIELGLRRLARLGVRSLLGPNSDPRGFAPLREHLGRHLAEIGIDAFADQILLTSGVAGAIDLVVRYLIRPRDAVFVDEPGHFQTFGQLRSLHAAIHGVPWTDTGPDVRQLECMAKTHSPRLFITNSIVHDPTGHTISRGTAYRVLQLAERYDFYIVEDDASGTLHHNPPPRLASLDQLNRVIYVNSFSNVVSRQIPIGYLAGHRDLVRDLVDLKMLHQAASPELAARLVHEILVQGQYRKYLANLRANIERAREAVLRRLEAIGLGPAESDTLGLFVWLDIPGVADTMPLAEAAVAAGMLLAPGAVFSPSMTPSPKMRFNVGFCQADETLRLLDAWLHPSTSEDGPS